MIMATASSQRRQSSGCLADLPTSLSTCQQRAHLSPSASSGATPTPGTSASVKRVAGRRAFDQLAARGDADLGEVEILHGRDVFLGDMDVRRGLQAGADALLARSSSSAPVTTRRSVADRLPLLAQRRHRARPAGISGKIRRCTLSAAAVRHVRGRASQASSAVKQGSGASHAVRQENSSAEHGARGAPAQRRRARRSRARPCGCRSRRPRGRRRRNCAARSRCLWKSKSSTAGAEHARRARPGDAAPSARARACRRRPTALGRRVAGEAAQQVAQRVAQPAIGLGLVLQDLRADAQVLGVVGADHPQAQDVGAVLVASRPAAR